MKFFIFFLVLFFVELMSLVTFSEEFGFFSLILEILLSGVLGVFLLFSALSGSNESILELLAGARNPKEILASNFSRVIGAIMLIIPGILSDCLGILLQFGILDFIFVVLFSKMKSTQNQAEIIDVEVIEEGERIENEQTHHRK